MVADRSLPVEWGVGGGSPCAPSLFVAERRFTPSIIFVLSAAVTDSVVFMVSRPALVMAPVTLVLAGVLADSGESVASVAFALI